MLSVQEINLYKEIIMSLQEIRKELKKLNDKLDKEETLSNEQNNKKGIN